MDLQLKEKANEQRFEESRKGNEESDSGKDGEKSAIAGIMPAMSVFKLSYFKYDFYTFNNFFKHCLWNHRNKRDEI